MFSKAYAAFFFFCILRPVSSQSNTSCNFFLGAREVYFFGQLLILAKPTRHSKGAPLCRYTGVARKVPFKFCPKDRKKVSDGYWKFVVPRGETKTEQLLPFGKLILIECDLIFSTHASERTSDNCVLGVELDKITGCLAYLIIGHFRIWLLMWQSNQNRCHRQSSLYGMHKMCHTIHFV